MSEFWLYPDKCKTKVLKRDTYRYTGRGSSGFEMYYNETQCARKAGPDGFCWQHRPKSTIPAHAAEGEGE